MNSPDPKIRPRKRWGQHFLTRPAIAAEIADSAGINASDTVVEIGGGTGILTEALARRAGRVITFEIDPQLVSLLRERFAGCRRVEVVAGDFLREGPPHLRKLPAFQVVANLPYYISTPVFFLLMDYLPALRKATLTLQKEVARRLTARPGNRDYGVLSVSASLLGKSDIIKTLGRGSFTPAPEVASAVVHFQPHPRPPVDAAEAKKVLELAQKVFGSRRKTMANCLHGRLRVPKAQGEEILRACGIDPSRRPETLALDDFIVLARSLRAHRDRA